MKDSDSDFWRDLGSDCRELSNRDFGAGYQYTVGKTGPATWTLGGSNSQGLRFGRIATRGAVRLAKGGHPLTLWLESLRKARLISPDERIVHELDSNGKTTFTYLIGHIVGVYAASVDLCAMLECRALESEQEPVATQTESRGVAADAGDTSSQVDSVAPISGDGRRGDSDSTSEARPEKTREHLIQERAERLAEAQLRWRADGSKATPFTWIRTAANVDHKNAYDWKTGKLADSSVMAERLDRELLKPFPPSRPKIPNG